jgi:hypothetical protein
LIGFSRLTRPSASSFLMITVADCADSPVNCAISALGNEERWRIRVRISRSFAERLSSNVGAFCDGR